MKFRQPAHKFKVRSLKFKVRRFPTLNFKRETLNSRSAFTLIELLVVIAIMGILASLGLLAVRGMTKSNALVAADRQLLDDLSYARRLAIANHTTVYVLFVPPMDPAYADVYNPNLFSAAPNLLPTVTNLWGGQYRSYALYAARSVGDQPGQTSPHYLTSWRTLPNAVYIATNKFFPSIYAPMFFTNAFYFPDVTNNAPMVMLPYVAFNYLGQLVYTQNGVDTPVTQLGSQNYEYISLAHGSIFYTRDQNGALQPQPADVQEIPPGNAYYTAFNGPETRTGAPLPGTNMYNQIYIDPLTGKARIQRQEVQ